MSILTELTTAQRGSINQQLRGTPKLPSQIIVEGLDPYNPQHRELVVRHIADLASEGKVRQILGPNTDVYGRPKKAAPLGWQWLEPDKKP